MPYRARLGARRQNQSTSCPSYSFCNIARRSNCRAPQIREERPQLHRRRLRLIHGGRLLTDSTQLASWLSTLEERQQRAATKDKDDVDSSIVPIAPGPSSVSWLLHCSVGPPLSEGEEDDDVQAQVRRRRYLYLFPC